MSKLQLNNKKLRHHWRGKEERCECGCKDRIWINGGFICVEKLREDLFQFGFNLDRAKKGDLNSLLTNNTGSVEGVDNAE